MNLKTFRWKLACQFIAETTKEINRWPAGSVVKWTEELSPHILLLNVYSNELSCKDASCRAASCSWIESVLIWTSIPGTGAYKRSIASRHHRRWRTISPGIHTALSQIFIMFWQYLVIIAHISIGTGQLLSDNGSFDNPFASIEPSTSLIWTPCYETTASPPSTEAGSSSAIEYECARLLVRQRSKFLEAAIWSLDE